MKNAFRMTMVALTLAGSLAAIGSKPTTAVAMDGSGPVPCYPTRPCAVAAEKTAPQTSVSMDGSGPVPCYPTRPCATK